MLEFIELSRAMELSNGNIACGAAFRHLMAFFVAVKSRGFTAELCAPRRCRWQTTSTFIPPPLRHVADILGYQGDTSEMKALGQTLTPVLLCEPPHRRSNQDFPCLLSADVQLETFVHKLSILSLPVRLDVNRRFSDAI